MTFIKNIYKRIPGTVKTGIFALATSALVGMCAYSRGYEQGALDTEVHYGFFEPTEDPKYLKHRDDLRIDTLIRNGRGNIVTSEDGSKMVELEVSPLEKINGVDPDTSKTVPLPK